MPKKRSKKIPFKVNWHYVAIVLGGMLVTFMTLHYVDRSEQRKADKLRDEAYFSQAVAEDRVQNVYFVTLDALRGSGAPDSDLQSMYDNTMSKDLAARVKTQGHISLFCSDQTPSELRFSRSDSEHYLTVNEFFSARATGTPDKVVRVKYDPKDSKLTTVYCP